jgi:hypothetical protein
MDTAYISNGVAEGDARLRTKLIGNAMNVKAADKPK